MAIPKLRFVAIGLLEALGLVAGMSAGGTDFACVLVFNRVLFPCHWDFYTFNQAEMILE